MRDISAQTEVITEAVAVQTNCAIATHSVGYQSDELVVTAGDVDAQVTVYDGTTQHCADDVLWTPAATLDAFSEVDELIRGISAHLPPLELFPELARRANDFEVAFQRVVEPLTEIVQHCDGEDGVVRQECGAMARRKRTNTRKR